MAIVSCNSHASNSRGSAVGDLYPEGNTALCCGESEEVNTNGQTVKAQKTDVNYDMSEKIAASTTNPALDSYNMANSMRMEKLSRFPGSRNFEKKNILSRDQLVVKRSVLVTLCTLVTMLGGRLLTLPPVSGFVPDFIEWGYCSEVHLQENFDPVKYEGWWWDIFRVPNSYEGVDKCIHQNITLKDDVMVVKTEGLSAKGIFSNKTAFLSTDTSHPVRNPARRTVDAEGVPAAPYLVMATDYLQYSCVYSCLQFPGVFAEFFWIFGRQPTLDEKYTQECIHHFRQAGVQPGKLEKVTQGEACPYAPRLKAMQTTNHALLKDVKRDERSEKLLSHSSSSTTDSGLLREGTSAAGRAVFWLECWGVSVMTATALWALQQCRCLCS
ncbi:Calycin [Trinorchestia longiramus]|nr:Calycin [Trinorchestia longiramus]